MEHVRAHAGLRRLARGDGLVGAVDVFLRALARACAGRNPQRDRRGWSARPGAPAGRCSRPGRGTVSAFRACLRPSVPPAVSHAPRAFPQGGLRLANRANGGRAWRRKRRRASRRGLSAGGPGEVAELYDAGPRPMTARWRGPDTGTRRSPALCARHLPRGAAPLLDAGAGNGTDGRMARHHGLSACRGARHIRGDAGAGARKGVYTALHVLALGGPLPFAKGHYAGIVSAGVFTSGHVGAEGLRSSVRHATRRRDGADGQEHAVDGASPPVGRVEAGVVEATAPYVSMPGEVGTTPSRGLVLRRL